MRKVILDTNIVIDIALERKPFNSDALKVFAGIKNNKIRAFVTATSITDIFYVLRKTLGSKETIRYLKSLLNIVGILDTDSIIIFEALDSDWNDFEDAVQGYSALYNNIDCIITRNLQDYQNLKGVEIASANEFANKYL